MLGSIRKFSTSIYAKILLFIIIIPFIFWGMGGSISGGNKNVVVVIDKEKYSIQDFTKFIDRTANEKVKKDQIQEFLSAFIGEKLIEKEVELFEIKLSDKSLSKLIKHQKDFKRNNEFSRTEYEKFLLKNNITAVTFESILSKQEKKKQLLDFISGGITPSKFLVDVSYDKVNQKREVELIDLNAIFKNKLNFSEEQIKTFFENNKSQYTELYKSIKFLELKPKKLVDNNEFNDLFFKIIDEIDNLIIKGERLDYIVQKFNLEKPNLITVNELGEYENSQNNKKITEEIIKRIFNISESEPVVLIEDKDQFFIVELIKTEDIEKSIKDEAIRNEIILDLSKSVKRKLISELISKINNKNFNKSDFDKLSRDENINIQKINLKNRNDNEILQNQIVNQIYAFGEKQIIVVNDIGLANNFLIYIDKIKNVTIKESSEDYQKYLKLSKIRIVNELYNTYDNYIKKRYEIEINYQALDAVKNYFNQ